jgi:hypothetical protein
VAQEEEIRGNGFASSGRARLSNLSSRDILFPVAFFKGEVIILIPPYFNCQFINFLVGTLRPKEQAVK